MKSVDTNVLVRLILGDDPHQSSRPEAIVHAGVFVPITVFLELGWVLGSRYGFNRQQLSATLSALLDLPSITIANEPAIRHTPCVGCTCGGSRLCRCVAPDIRTGDGGVRYL